MPRPVCWRGEIAELETIVVDNEREALALKITLIKRHRPKFNVLLRDDKTYPYIKFTAAENIRGCISREGSGRWLAVFWSVFSGQSGAADFAFCAKRFLVLRALWT